MDWDRVEAIKSQKTRPISKIWLISPAYRKFSKNGEFLDYMEIDLRIAWAKQIILDSAQAV